MKFSCEKSVLYKAIAIAQEIITNKNFISVVSNVYLELNDNRLTIKGTNVKLGLITYIEVDGHENGSCIVFCEKFVEILSALPDGVIEFEETGNVIKIKPAFKKVQFNIKVISNEQFPSFSEISADKYIDIPAEKFKKMIRLTSYAVSDDETRYFLSGVYFEYKDGHLIMVGTDGKRLALCKVRFDLNKTFKGVIIPPKTLAFFLKYIPNEGVIKFFADEKNIFVSFGNIFITSILVEGEFPNYEKVIPASHEFEAVIKRQDMLEAFRRISIFIEKKSRKAIMTFSPEKLTLVSEEMELGTAREEIDCLYDGAAISISVKDSHIEEPLKFFDTEDVSIKFNANNSAILLSPVNADDTYFNVIMPMNID
ncbi:MAG TPA: DNA polymerase III subunit beta [Spirochaetia bacterium]|nr:DNA polymerase III subunit beta [Spirochaetales bacterium]HPD79975.1 DNA polymerase III subunit beta [Spirochaetales bacterium]HQK34307.1 DNA polymerase III subunit beta [Spirochaetales bacterium]HRS64412.1 DNA polymerase III subunit beta [Spirochaetia bacterium]HRV28566.1 DNA polymerase III subunit beta [Spirochaetia bacterium]